MPGIKRARWGALVACLALSGCGGSDGGGGAAEPTTSETSSAAAVEEVTMLDACPEVEAALPTADGLLPDPQDVLTFERRLNELREAGDVETVNALDLLSPATGAVLDASDAGGSAVLDARAAWRDGISAFADRCAAAGSSALR